MVAARIFVGIRALERSEVSSVASAPKQRNNFQLGSVAAVAYLMADY